MFTLHTRGALLWCAPCMQGEHFCDAHPTNEGNVVLCSTSPVGCENSVGQTKHGRLDCVYPVPPSGAGLPGSAEAPLRG